MKPTVKTPISPKHPESLGSLLYWQNKEASPILTDMRAALNSRGMVQKKLTTQNTGLATQIYQEDLPFAGAWAVDAYVLGWTPNGTDRMRLHLGALFARYTGGAAVQQGATSTVTSITSNAAFTASLSVSGNGMQLQVNDGSLGVADWDAVLLIQEVT